GADFAGVAASSSDGPQALEGGVLGVRPIQGWPDLFIEATRGLKAGEVSRIFRSGQGFHILKVLTWGEPQQAAARPAAPDVSIGAAGANAMDGGPVPVWPPHARPRLGRANQRTAREQAHRRRRVGLDRVRVGGQVEVLALGAPVGPTPPLGGVLGGMAPEGTV